MEMKIRTKKCCHAFKRVGTLYRGLPKFMPVDIYVGFPVDGYSFCFTSTEFHVVSSASTSYKINISLQ
jgi:hypothetical protein